VVVIVMGDAAAGVTAIGRALAAEMNWRFVNEHDSSDSSEATTLTRVRDTRLLAGREHSQWLRRFRSTIATAVDRREHVVVACPILTHADRQALRIGLRPIRFVSLQHVTRASPAANDVVIADAAWPTERILGAIRDEFGL
jgi:gluconate kinase